MGFMAVFVKSSIFAALFLILCGCKTLPNESADRYVYYVIDVNGTEPDAEFIDRNDAVNCRHSLTALLAASQTQYSLPRVALESPLFSGIVLRMSEVFS